MQHTERFTGQHGALLVIDVQEKLVPRIVDRDLVIANAVRLVRGGEVPEAAGLGDRAISRGPRPDRPRAR